MSTDKFDNIPRIVLDKEDREAFQRGRNTKSGKSPKVAPETPAAEAAPANSSNGIWIFLTFVVALGGYGASYWLYQQNQQQLQVLGDAEQRIEELERKISATGEELDQSAVALRVQVNELKDKSDVLWQEMDKLWASAWRRNQTEIKDLSENVTRGFREQTQKITGLENDVSLAGTNMAVIQEQVDKHKSEVTRLTNTVNNALKNRSNSEQELKKLTDQIATSALRLEALADRINKLEQLKQQVDALSSKPAPTPPPATTIRGASGTEQSPTNP
ncbi:MAG: hypothetical protein ACFHVJ_07990 [Aestuariibacter sp.]